MHDKRYGSSKLGKLIALGVVGAIAWFARKPRPPSKTDKHAAAFADGETHRENFDQTRSAGPAAMRDLPRRIWTPVDQAGDEAFSASDPPSY